MNCRSAVSCSTASTIRFTFSSGERVSFLERDIKSWVELLDAQNTITVPAFGKR